MSGPRFASSVAVIAHKGRKNETVNYLYVGPSRSDDPIRRIWLSIDGWDKEVDGPELIEAINRAMGVTP